MNTLDGDTGLDRELAAIRPEQADAFADSLRASVRRSLTGAAEPFRLGRFTVLEPLGGGGMGVVFVAYDPDLDRKIALKVLRNAGERGQLEVLREGRALARLKHPNVVTVYEVGVLDDHVFVAMEHVTGANMREWLRTPRSPESILARLIEAGRGLAAAHAVDLVHRDCKPENLMIDGDGHTRVVDFGLARPLAELRPGDATRDRSAVATRSLRAGTPAYMAPERLAGAPGDARADQYSFCVTCWEALFGARPPAELDGHRVPAWLRRALERGLATDPAQRWPAMAPLLAALEQGSTRRRLRTAALALAGVAAVAAGAVAYHRWDREQRAIARRDELARREAECVAAGAEIDAAWDDRRRQALRDAFLATSLNYAGIAVDRVTPWLDEQAGAWRSARADACRSADDQLGGLWSADTLDRAAWCLEDRRLELDALVTEFTHATGPTVDKAVSAAAGLKPVGDCVDESLLQRRPGPPAGDRSQVGEVRAELSRARSLKLTGDYAQGLTVATAARTRAEAVDWPPLWAAARALEGDLLERTGAYEQAEHTSVDAYFAAVRADAWDVAATAATNLIYVVGSVRARHDEGRLWGRHAEAASGHAGDRSGLAESSRLNVLAFIDQATAASADAQARLERALALLEAVHGPDHPNVANVLNSLAITHEDAGAFDQARALHQRSLAIHEKVLGPEHPMLAMNLINLGTVAVNLGDFEQASALFTRALEIDERALGREHVTIASILNNLGIVRTYTGEFAEARRLFERAIAIYEKAVGPGHPDLATSLDGLAAVHQATGAIDQAVPLLERAMAIREQVLGPDHLEVARSLDGLSFALAARGQHAEARALRERALASREQALGPDHPHVAASLNNLATALVDLGEWKAARPLFDRSLAIRERAFGLDHPDISDVLINLASLDLKEKRPADALARLERAVAIVDGRPGAQYGEYEAHYELARALVATDGDRARALAAATRARDGFRETGAAANLVEAEKLVASLERPRGK